MESPHYRNMSTLLAQPIICHAGMGVLFQGSPSQTGGLKMRRVFAIQGGHLDAEVA